MKITEDSFRYQLSEYDVSVPVDLIALIGYVVIADLVIVTIPTVPTSIRTLLGLPLVLFVPGYAVLAALFPGRKTTDTPGWRIPVETGLNIHERALFGFGVSVALLPVLSVVLSVTGIGFGVVPMIATVTLVGGLGALVGAVRRQRLSTAEQFDVPVRRWGSTLADAWSGSNAVVNVVLTIAVVIAVGSLVFGLVAPSMGESYSSFSLLTTGENGDFEAAGYPTTLPADDTEILVVGVENHERRALDYTVVIQLQRVQGSGEELAVVERRELDRVGASVGPGEAWREPIEVEPSMTGEDLRLQFLLFRADPPADPTAESAYRDLHLWVTVTDS